MKTLYILITLLCLMATANAGSLADPFEFTDSTKLVAVDLTAKVDSLEVEVNALNQKLVIMSARFEEIRDFYSTGLETSSTIFSTIITIMIAGLGVLSLRTINRHNSEQTEKHKNEIELEMKKIRDYVSMNYFLAYASDDKPTKEGSKECIKGLLKGFSGALNMNPKFKMPKKYVKVLTKITRDKQITDIEDASDIFTIIEDYLITIRERADGGGNNSDFRSIKRFSKDFKLKFIKIP